MYLSCASYTPPYTEINIHQPHESCEETTVSYSNFPPRISVQSALFPRGPNFTSPTSIDLLASVTGIAEDAPPDAIEYLLTNMAPNGTETTVIDPEDFLDKLVEFPDGNSFERTRPITDYRRDPGEARILYTCRSCQQPDDDDRTEEE
jgi:hypothetical protein